MNDLTPILVTGSHRSGTTWVGKMLAADVDTAYISEPLNVLHRPGVYRVPVKYWYTYITEENEAGYLSAFHELLNFQYHLLLEIRSIRSVKDFLRMGRDFRIFFNGSMHGQRALIKDPFAVFSTPWFAKRLNCQVVITARHPGGFVSSLKRLGW
ncbi:MAG TPA: sulfotransferase family protein, partial [Anaerolineae bacterium]|nr:sulfotransferase family protein [Anaerolineae bacterium]